MTPCGATSPTAHCVPRSTRPCGAPVPESPSASVQAGPVGPLPGAGLEADAATANCRSVDVVVCRGCCCGTLRKHPSCDHDAQLDAIRAAVAAIPGARLRVAGCLDFCRRSNLVGIRDWRGPEVAVTWLGEMLAAPDTTALVRYLGSGGRLPGRLRRRRVCLDRPFPQDFDAHPALGHR